MYHISANCELDGGFWFATWIEESLVTQEVICGPFYRVLWECLWHLHPHMCGRLYSSEVQPSESSSVLGKPQMRMRMVTIWKSASIKPWKTVKSNKPFLRETRFKAKRIIFKYGMEEHGVLASPASAKCRLQQFSVQGSDWAKETSDLISVTWNS